MTSATPEGSEAPTGWAVAATVLAVVALCYLLRIVLFPLVLVTALAFVLTPTVDRLRRRLPHVVAVLVVHVAVLVVAGALAWSLVDVFGDQTVAALAEAPRLLAEEIRRLFGPEIHAFGQTLAAEDVAARIVDTLRQAVPPSTATIALGGLAVGAPAIAALMLVVLFYLLHAGRDLSEGLLRLVPPRHRGHVRSLGRSVAPMLRHYVRGMIVLTLYAAAMAWLALGAVAHMRFAVPLALLVGVFELVPVVGPAAAMALFAGVALLQGGGLWTIVAFMGFAVLLRVSIDLLVGPLVLGHAVTLHPVVIILAFLIGASLFGLLGVFLAVPVAASVRIVLAVWYDEADDAGQPRPRA